MSELSKKLYPRIKREKNTDNAVNLGKYYIKNDVLLPAVIRAKAEGKITKELAKMILLLCNNYVKKSNFNGYSFKDDMVSEAVINLCKNALKFNPERSDNPFAFFTTCITNSFLQFLNNEKKHRRIRDQLLIDLGENPSYNFEVEHKTNVAENNVHKDDLNILSVDIEEAKERESKEIIRDNEKDVLSKKEKKLKSEKLIQY